MITGQGFLQRLKDLGQLSAMVGGGDGGCMES